MLRNYSQICNIFKYCVNKMLNNIVVFSKTKTQSGAFSESTSFVNAIHRKNYSTGTIADDCHGGMMLKIEIFVVFCVVPLTCGKYSRIIVVLLQRDRSYRRPIHINVFLGSDSNKEKRKLHCQWWWHCLQNIIWICFILWTYLKRY